MTEFRDNVVVITGAGSGIGKATALAFARQGARLHLSDIDAEAVGAVADEATTAGAATTTAYRTDVSDHDDVTALADAVFAAEGGVDVLHNNAGVGHGGEVQDTPISEWRRVLDVNLMGVVHGVEAFVPRMLTQGRPGHVVNTASLLGLIAGGRLAPYTTSKFAVVGLSESLDSELAPQGIRVTALCPGVINTNIVATASFGGEMAERKQKAIDLYRKHGTSPDVVAEAVLSAVRRPRGIVVTPRWQVLPQWLLKRASVRLSRPLSQRMASLMSPGG
ncbi:MAG: SDR family NAD(P)-dependent oxidoreductase [Solirubrobacterales bacterium]